MLKVRENRWELGDCVSVKTYGNKFRVCYYKITGIDSKYYYLYGLISHRKSKLEIEILDLRGSLENKIKEDYIDVTCKL